MTDKWISVKDQMPAIDQFVLATGDELGEYIDGPKVEICRWSDIGWWDEGGTEFFSAGKGVVAWMPLPELWVSP